MENNIHLYIRYFDLRGGNIQPYLLQNFLFKKKKKDLDTTEVSFIAFPESISFLNYRDDRFSKDVYPSYPCFYTFTTYLCFYEQCHTAYV